MYSAMRKDVLFDERHALLPSPTSKSYFRWGYRSQSRGCQHFHDFSDRRDCLEHRSPAGSRRQPKCVVDSITEGRWLRCQRGVRVLRTPPFAPQANCYCERLIGTTRRECLDFLIPLSEKHLRRLLCEWRDYYNRARPGHSSLGPNVPEPASALHVDPAPYRHQIPSGKRIVSRLVLGGLHHDYRLAHAA